MEELAGPGEFTQTGTEREETDAGLEVESELESATIGGVRSLEPILERALVDSTITVLSVKKPIVAQGSDGSAPGTSAMELDDQAVPPDQSPSEIPSSTPLQTDLSTIEPPPPGAPDPTTGLERTVTEAWDVMDLASFLEFAIHSTHCLEILHKAGHIHREVRANAFHVNVHSGVVRFSHFGNRSESLERTGGPSALVIQADSMPFSEQKKVKEAICYLAPEQTGTAETTTEDHRTDLYALGVLFWTLLVGHGTLPFEGSPVEMLHQVVQQKPVEVHEIRRDVPVVLSHILTKVTNFHKDNSLSFIDFFDSFWPSLPTIVITLRLG
jgi:serine/threonine protein kinase